MGPVERLQQYLRYDTANPSPALGPCVAFLQTQAAELGLCHRVYARLETKPVLIMYDELSDKEALLLSSHMDVVPVPDAAQWQSGPFDAAISSDGCIVARGAQDMKSVGMAYLEALRAVLPLQPRTRRVVLVYTPDEEVGSADGMQWLMAQLPADPFLQRTRSSAHPTELFRGVALGLDEGCPSPGGAFVAFWEERRAYWLRCVFRTANCGHGSTLPTGTAMVQFLAWARRVSAFRERQTLLLKEKTLGQVTSVNINAVHVNIIPNEVVACLDLRTAEPPSAVRQWMEEWGCPDYELLADVLPPGAAEDARLAERWWPLIEGQGFPVQRDVFPGATDARFVRSALGVPVVGISPMRATPLRLHDRDECLHVDRYAEAIEYYTRLLGAILCSK